LQVAVASSKPELPVFHRWWGNGLQLAGKIQNICLTVLT
jgi:hypothetical protein